jgi:hypothetical protein
MIKIFSKNSILIHNSPFLTRNVSQKERIKILKQKKSLHFRSSFHFINIYYCISYYYYYVIYIFEHNDLNFQKHTM